jgi:hypothetical protein
MLKKKYAGLPAVLKVARLDQGQKRWRLEVKSLQIEIHEYKKNLQISGGE